MKRIKTLVWHDNRMAEDVSRDPPYSYLNAVIGSSFAAFNAG